MQHFSFIIQFVGFMKRHGCNFQRKRLAADTIESASMALNDKAVPLKIADPVAAKTAHGNLNSKIWVYERSDGEKYARFISRSPELNKTTYRRLLALAPAGVVLSAPTDCVHIAFDAELAGAAINDFLLAATLKHNETVKAKYDNIISAPRRSRGRPPLSAEVKAARAMAKAMIPVKSVTMSKSPNVKKSESKKASKKMMIIPSEMKPHSKVMKMVDRMDVDSMEMDPMEMDAVEMDAVEMDAVDMDSINATENEPIFAEASVSVVRRMKRGRPAAAEIAITGYHGLVLGSRPSPGLGIDVPFFETIPVSLNVVESTPIGTDIVYAKDIASGDTSTRYDFRGLHLEKNGDVSIMAKDRQGTLRYFRESEAVIAPVRRRRERQDKQHEARVADVIAAGKRGPKPKVMNSKDKKMVEKTRKTLTIAKGKKTRKTRQGKVSRSRSN